MSKTLKKKVKKKAIKKATKKVTKKVSKKFACFAIPTRCGDYSMPCSAPGMATVSFWYFLHISGTDWLERERCRQ